ncbi:hypothetical protein [uncultured Sutterella sp.]|uniref:biotin--[acetyl-CoA-carboxylase] ligase n=1 Tax=uncultured Sutterella sp. TaxID=286133 RepID=UPI0025DF2D92|nr:hypothetical protein [uncultured Sutterella sp.]
MTTAVPVLRLAAADSVLITARERFAAGELPVFGSVFADRQTAGHGQYGRAWESREGNVHGAVRLPAKGVWASPASAAALAALIADELNALGFLVRLKWPNDLVVLQGGRPAKAGGILIEERGGLLTAGVGLNLNWAPPVETLREGAALPPGRLADADPTESAPAAREADSFVLWNRIVRRIAAEDPAALLLDWREAAAGRLLWQGETVEVADPEGPGSGRLEGRLLGLSETGELVLQAGARTFSLIRGSIARADRGGGLRKRERKAPVPDLLHNIITRRPRRLPSEGDAAPQGGGL